MVILAAFKSHFWIALAAATTLIFGAAYTLWMVKRVIFGDVTNHHVAEMIDLNRREFLIMFILAVGVIGLGFYPAPVIDVMHASMEHLVQQAMTSKLP
jgi:NADH-quinone oxidoreductase subunit M